jgi:signal transduction histidine kinase
VVPQGQPDRPGWSLLGTLRPSKVTSLGAALTLAAVFLVVEAVLVVLLKQVDPRDPVGIVIALLMAAALFANFVAGVAAARAANAARRQEAELAAELARLMLRTGDLQSALNRVAHQLAQDLKLPFASLELDEVDGDERRWAIPLRNGTSVLGTLLVPADIPKATQQRLQQRIVPSLTALLGAARDRDAIDRALTASGDMLAVLAEQQKALRRVATLVACGFSPEEVFSSVAEEMALCLHAEDAEVLRYEPDSTATVVGCCAELGEQYFFVGERISLDGDGVAARVLHTLRTSRMDGYKNAAPGSLAGRIRDLGLRSQVGAPIIVDGRVWGVALVGSSRPEPLPADTEERISDFAELVATAILNAATRAELIASRARIVAAADSARRRLERDLHDGAQQRLVSLALELRSAEASVPHGLDDSFRQQLSGITSGLTDLTNDVQEISRGIHPAILSHGGLGPALNVLAKRSAVPVTLDVAIDRRMAEPVELAGYYVVAEALTNAAKHADASEVSVRAETRDCSLHISIRDDGIGGANFGKGSGLIGLKDRVEALSGQMQLASHPGSGTSIDIRIPLGQ